MININKSFLNYITLYMKCKLPCLGFELVSIYNNDNRFTASASIYIKMLYIYIYIYIYTYLYGEFVLLSGKIDAWIIKC